MVSCLVGKILNGTTAILILHKDPHLFTYLFNLSHPMPPSNTTSPYCHIDVKDREVSDLNFPILPICPMH